jgi:hypothetical protein
MIRAISVGETAILSSARGVRGSVTKVFREAAYIWFGDDMIVVTRGGAVSPVSIVLEMKIPLCDAVHPGDKCTARGEYLDLGSLSIWTGGARRYRTGRESEDVRLPGDECLIRSAAALRMLYDVSEGSRIFLESCEFLRFSRWLVNAATRGGSLYSLERYADVIGLGAGFTPAGDDMLSGFLATFNRAARSHGWRQIGIPFDFVSARTSRESAALLNYSQRGVLDERIEGQLKYLLSGNEEGYVHELLASAPRGHTSGLDTSLGILLCAAVLAERERRSGIARRVLGTLTARQKQFK